MRSVISRSPFSRSPRQTSDTFPFREGTQGIAAENHGLRRLEARRAMEEHQYLASRARARKYNPPIDLRLLDYVSTYDNNLMCPICRCPFIDPVILVECDHCFCSDCIRQTWNTGPAYTPAGLRGNCPTCRTPAKLGPRSAACKILVNMTDDLLVRCPKANEGCKAEIKRGEIQDHMNIYCALALEECPTKDCELPVLRKDATEGCLHYSVSCLSCRKELQKWRLEAHWKNDCPERNLQCESCQATIFSRDLDEHNKTTCPAASIPCPGEAFGCSYRSKKPQVEIHAVECPLAKVAPALTRQQDRLDGQEAAQRQLVRKLDVLESGFSAIERILCPTDTGGNSSLAHDLLDVPTAESFISSEIGIAQPSPSVESRDVRSPSASHLSEVPDPRSSDLSEPYTADFDQDGPETFPLPDNQNGPYASPLHHLLSMHESLRDEMTRMSSALSELEGRQSMQMLNENLRTREEISYLGAQVGGLQRQVHWLTSSQLQRQQVGRSPTPAAGPSAGTAISDAATGADVEAAVSAVSNAATALRGGARMVSVGGRDGSGMRRRPSEEGRTKL